MISTIHSDMRAITARPRWWWIMTRGWVACAICLSACTTVQYRSVPLPLPARPVLTPVTASQVQCLAPDAYTALVNRERALRTWGLELEAAIKANNAKAKP